MKVILFLFLILLGISGETWNPGNDCYSWDLNTTPTILHEGDNGITFKVFMRCNHGCLPTDQNLIVYGFDKSYTWNIFTETQSSNKDYCYSLGPGSTTLVYTNAQAPYQGINKFHVYVNNEKVHTFNKGVLK